MDLLAFLAIDVALVLLIVWARRASRARALDRRKDQGEDGVDLDDAAELVDADRGRRRSADNASEASHDTGSTRRMLLTTNDAPPFSGGAGGRTGDERLDVEREDVARASDDIPGGASGGDLGGGDDGGGGDGGGDGGGSDGGD